MEILEELKKNNIKVYMKGTRYFVCCPFHKEDTPSCCIYPNENKFYCFGCGEKGSGEELLEKFTGKSYGSKKIPIEYQINKEAALYFKNNLKNNEKILSQFSKRGVTKNTIELFDIGLSADIKPVLDKFGLKGKIEGYSLLNSKGESFFNDRLMFPIKDKDGIVKGFTGRTINGDEVKYLNTLSLKKGEMLFNLNNAIEKANKSKRIFLVEGPFDVLAYHFCGFDNVVSPLTCSMTPEQCNLLKENMSPRYEVVIAFDSDKAGRKGAMRTIKNLLNAGFYKIKIIFYKERKDASEYLENLDNKLTTYAKNPLSLGEYFSYFLKKSRDANEKRAVLENITDSISTFPKNVIINQLKILDKEDRAFILERIEGSANLSFKYLCYQFKDKEKLKKFESLINLNMLTEDEKTLYEQVKKEGKYSYYKNEFDFDELLILFLKNKIKSL